MSFVSVARVLWTAVLGTDAGARVRAALVSLSGVAAAVVLFLQDVTGVVEVLPESGVTERTLVVLLGAVSFLGRFTNIGGGSQSPAAASPAPSAPITHPVHSEAASGDSGASGAILEGSSVYEFGEPSAR